MVFSNYEIPLAGINKFKRSQNIFHQFLATLEIINLASSICVTVRGNRVPLSGRVRTGDAKLVR